MDLQWLEVVNDGYLEDFSRLIQEQICNLFECLEYPYDSREWKNPEDNERELLRK